MAQAQNLAVHGIRHFAFGAVGSTNDEAFRLAGAGEPAPFWVTAERQERGRGRQGAPWISERGNLHASHLLNASAANGRIAELPLVFAVALHGAIAAAFGGAAAHRLRIKWPNDILLDGLKVAGILAESRSLPPMSRLVVAGFGVNLAHHPDGTRHPATDLRAAGFRIGPDMLFPVLAGELERRLKEWDRGNGFAAIRAAWIACAAGLGEAIAVRLPDRTLHGRFIGLDEAGRLVLEAGGERRSISGGDIFFRTDPQTAETAA
jgi:BirA family transcriptional regulator, biotin operon repressor / biotin---[acetyl-CoA-carboxylase] ligase